jgi:hypothetical protein
MLRPAIHWLFAVVFIATASCAMAHSEAGLQKQSAPACSHHQPEQQPSGSPHCDDCMKVHFVQESKVLAGHPAVLLASAILDEASVGITSVIAPGDQLPSDKLILFTRPILRI